MEKKAGIYNCPVSLLHPGSNGRLISASVLRWGHIDLQPLAAQVSAGQSLEERPALLTPLLRPVSWSSRPKGPTMFNDLPVNAPQAALVTQSADRSLLIPPQTIRNLLNIFPVVALILCLCVVHIFRAI